MDTTQLPTPDTRHPAPPAKLDRPVNPARPGVSAGPAPSVAAPRPRRWGKLSVERLLQILMGTLAATGTLLLGMGQGNLLLPALMLLAVVASILFTDTLRWFRLHRAVANLAAIVAVGFSLAEFVGWRDDTHRQLLAIAHLLIYLQVVLLFQRKSERIYWQLAVLGLLQVVVAAALNAGVEFGVVLVIFSGVALWALAVFFVQRTSSRFPEVSAGEEARRKAPGSGRGEAGSSRPRTVPGGAPGGVQTLRGGPPTAEPQATADDIRRELLVWGFARHVLGMGLATIVFTAVFFYCTPRIVGSHPRQQAGGEIVGFTNEVELNEVGRIAQSRELVMRVHFSELLTGEPYTLFSEPYFRGMVLNKYVAEGSRVRWRSLRPPITRPPIPLPAAKPRAGLVLQEILLQPRTEALLFSVAPAWRMPSAESPANVLLDPSTGQLYRGVEEELKLKVPFRYLVVTDAFRDGVQQPFRLRYWDERQTYQDKLRLAIAKRALLENYSFERFPRLSALADEVVRQGNVDPSDPLGKARLLQNHFHDPERYAYTLDFRQVPRDMAIDPIEDFVANHRSGHCEYFASALTMMLRSQGIPARLVIGYKGGEFNQLGGYFQVRQSSAHAWVEAFIDAEHLPPRLRDMAGENLAGAWLRLDPTPGAAAVVEERRPGSLIQRMGHALDYAQLLWSDYVLGLTPQRQQQAGLRTFAPEEESEEPRRWTLAGWRDAVDEMLRRAGLDVYNWRLRDWFSWRAGLAGMTLATLALLGYRLLALAWQKITFPRRAARQDRVRRRVHVDFYERLEAILEGAGLRREPHQTQREFILTAAARLQAEPPEEEPPFAWTRLLPEVVDSFYAVRFGAHTLDNQESEAIEHALQRLERALGRRPPR